MTKNFFLFTCCLSSLKSFAFSECFLCEEINERNRNLPPPKYEYYDDYLEDLKNQKEIEENLGDISFDESEK